MNEAYGGRQLPVRPSNSPRNGILHTNSSGTHPPVLPGPADWYELKIIRPKDRQVYKEEPGEHHVVEGVASGNCLPYITLGV